MNTLSIPSPAAKSIQSGKSRTGTTPNVRYGFPDADLAYYRDLDSKGVFGLLETDASLEMAMGAIPDIWEVCADLFESLFAPGSTFTALEFLPVLAKVPALSAFSLKEFLHNPQTKHVLVDDPLLKIVLIHWKPGSESSIHGHPGGGGVYKLLHGRLKEKRYSTDHERRLTGTQIMETGCMTYIDDNMGFHAVSNPYETSAVSLHAYVKG